MQVEKEINLKSVGRYHFGAMHDIRQLAGKHFEETEPKTDIINKAIIHTLTYSPDSIYNTTDGYFGNCWSAIILDSRDDIDAQTYKLNFRNPADLFAYFEEQKMKFI